MSKKPLWSFPWKLMESLIIGLGLLIIGSLIEYFDNNTILAPSWPLNFIIAISFPSFLLIIHWIFKDSGIVKWLSSPGAAISSIIFFTGLSVIMGLIPQVRSSNAFVQKLELNNITSSLQFLLQLIFFLTVLGLTILKRLKKINRKNIGFFFNHFGLWLVIISASLGSGDIKKYSMTAYENGSPEWRAFNENGDTIAMNLAIKLKDFDIEEYDPKLLIINHNTLDIIGDPILIDSTMKEFSLEKYHFKITQFLKNSIRFDDKYISVKHHGTFPAVYVEQINSDTRNEGWISCGSFQLEGEFLKIDSTFSLAMNPPEPKRFFSDITVYTDDENSINARIEVNKPLKIKNWKIYQSGYDKSFGKWSPSSTFELVKDPWLPAVYVGIFMMIIGVFFLIWQGEKLKH